MITISEIMQEDHVKTMRMINEFRSGWANLEQLKRAVERHFFIEEKAVFGFKTSNDPADLAHAIKLVKEHNDLLDMMTDIENCSENEKKLMFEKFIKKMQAHSRYEDEEFYPSLDRNLTNAQKSEIISKIRRYDKPSQTVALKTVIAIKN